ncbi:hypothetical protein NEOC65_001311 [Neochlamydia sp. AcF65]|nr:hypothetical protein [Neochlamydia sp. AcF65]MBS4170366.1 hypothetical protein [Neochlamydia sp. AcF95]
MLRLIYGDLAHPQKGSPSNLKDKSVMQLQIILPFVKVSRIIKVI